MELGEKIVFFFNKRNYYNNLIRQDRLLKVMATKYS